MLLDDLVRAGNASTVNGRIGQLMLDSSLRCGRLSQRTLRPRLEGERQPKETPMHIQIRRLRALFIALLISASLVGGSVAAVSADVAGAPWPMAAPAASPQDVAGAPWPK